MEPSCHNILDTYHFIDMEMIRVKLTKSKDYTLAYLDFFVYDQSDTQYFTLHSPFPIYLAGEGNFIRPYYLAEDDYFLQILFYLVNRKPSSSSDLLEEKQ